MATRSSCDQLELQGLGDSLILSSHSSSNGQEQEAPNQYASNVTGDKATDLDGAWDSGASGVDGAWGVWQRGARSEQTGSSVGASNKEKQRECWR